MLDPPEQGRVSSIVRFIVVPAKAGTYFSAARTADKWIPAFADMTRRDVGEDKHMARIAVGGFQHETNTFAPQRATWADFERADAWPGFIRGPELIDAVQGYNIPIAGAVDTLQGLGHALVP